MDPSLPVKNWLEMQALEQNSLSPLSSYYSCPRYKSKLRVVQTVYGDDIVKILQITQIADFVIYLLSSEVEVDEWGENVLRCIKANGAVSHLTLVQNQSNADSVMQIESKNKRKEESKERKQLMEALKSISSYMEHHFSVDSPCGFISDSGDMWKAVRHISEQRPKHISWREDRPYLIVDDMFFDASEGKLQITGIARGSCNFSANRIVHLPQIGDFELDSITLAADPFKSRSGNNAMSLDTDDSAAMESEDIEPLIPRGAISGHVVQRRDERFSEKLENSENIPDTFASEQTFPTEDELLAGDSKFNIKIDI